jgi:hypothetical protein
MPGYNSQFDTKKSILPDLTIKPIVETVVEIEEHLEEDNEPASPLPPTDEDGDIFIGQKKDKIITIEVKEKEETALLPEELASKNRGKDKKVRKKREFTPAMREKLANARKLKQSKAAQKKARDIEAVKHAAIEEYKTSAKKKKNEQILPPPETAKQPSFDDFCTIMDKYEAYKNNKKTAQVSTSKHPHPNKIVRGRGLPRPPATSGVLRPAPSLLQVQKKTYNKWAF